MSLPGTKGERPAAAHTGRSGIGLRRVLSLAREAQDAAFVLEGQMTVVLNDIQDLQLSLREGIECLRELLADRQHQGCTITPTDEALASTTGFNIQALASKLLTLLIIRTLPILIGIPDKAHGH